MPCGTSLYVTHSLITGFTSRQTLVHFVQVEQRSGAYVLLSLSLLIVGALFRLFDRSGELCSDGRSAFQGHSVWHVSCSAAVFGLYLYLRSEVLQLGPVNEVKEVGPTKNLPVPLQQVLSSNLPSEPALFLGQPPSGMELQLQTASNVDIDL